MHDHADHAHHDEPADLLDLDAEVLHEYWDTAMSWLAERVQADRARRLVDLGSGSGVGTLALARRYPQAHITAVDTSEALLSIVHDKVARHGLDRRVDLVAADLDHGLPRLGALDLTWASMSMHHLADPVRTLRELRAATTPGGSLAVAELVDELRFLPDEPGVGAPGLEQRLLEATTVEHVQAMPHFGADWRPLLDAAGWQVVDHHVIEINALARRDDDARRYAQLALSRQVEALADQLDAADRRAWAELLDGDGPLAVRHRDDLVLRARRALTLARRD